jgi:ferric-dicitrate binding protein FerR (iron transport regulator)
MTTDERDRLEDERLDRELAVLAAVEASADGFAAAVAERAFAQPPAPAARVRRWWYALGGALAGAAVGAAVTVLVMKRVAQDGTAADVAAEHAASAPTPRGWPSGAHVPALAPAPPVDAAAFITRLAGLVEIVKRGQARAAEPGDAIGPGDELRARGAAAMADLALPGDVRVELGADTRVRPSASAPGTGRAVEISEGTLSARVPSGPGRPAVSWSTPQARVTTAGARFVLSVSASRTRLDVLEGQATLAPRAGGTVEVKAAAMAVTGAGAERPSVRALAGEILFVRGNTGRAIAEPDRLLVDRLIEHGYFVSPIPAAEATAAQAQGKLAVVISSTTWSDVLGATFREVAVPVVTWEPELFDDLALTSAAALGKRLLDDASVAIHGDHPLAAGLRGTVRVAHAPGEMTWGTPASSAVRVATLPGTADRWAIFAYDKGSLMQGVVAPARRVALFLQDDTPLGLTDAGLALFDAAISWATGDARP